MADKENKVISSSRASRKRPSESTSGNQTTKKRAVLGELTNTPSNESASSPSSIVSKTRKSKVDTDCDLVVTPGPDVFRRLDYAPSMYQHLRSLEVEARRRPLSNYMEKVQTDINPMMRAVLIDWLVEVSEEYRLVSDTLYLTINYVDRYLSTHNVVRNKLQLLGVSCMLVASKYEEISPPHIEDFCYITDNTYTTEEVLHMEQDVLTFLDFELSIPTTKTFTRIFTRTAQEKPLYSSLKFDPLCCYLAELSLLDYGCVRYIPSVIAASAIFLARMTIQPEIHPWTLALQQHTGYKPYELKECVLRLHNIQLKSEKSARAIWQKYMDHKFKRVASLNPPSNVPACFFEITKE